MAIQLIFEKSSRMFFLGKKLLMELFEKVAQEYFFGAEYRLSPPYSP